MGRLDGVDTAGRQIAGLLGYNPGPGIYSRLERAVEAMPANVRVQELPGLLKRYKEGVPGWELKATDLDSTIAGRDVVPRDELLAAVKERSPVYTHKEVVLGGNPPTGTRYRSEAWGTPVPLYKVAPSPLGRGAPHGRPRYEDVGQGGQNYTEILLLQPGAGRSGWDHHWRGIEIGGAYPASADDAVAHARFDTHGDALRINEIQSDLGIHNRKVREAIQEYKAPPAQHRSESDSAYLDRVREMGYVLDMGDDGNWVWSNDPRRHGVAFPMEDAYLDYFAARTLLEAARGGHRAVEIASPLAISRGATGKIGTGMNIDKLDHLMHKMVAPRLERLGRKMGGMVDESPPPFVSPSNAHEEIRKLLQQADGEMQRAGWRARGHDPSPVPGREGELWLDGPSLGRTGWRNFAAMQYAANPEVYDRSMDALGGRVFTPDVWGGYGPPDMQAVGDTMYDDLIRHEGLSPQAAGQLVGEALRLADQSSQIRARYLRSAGAPRPSEVPPISRRYQLSDEMRRRLIEQGVGASLLAPLLMQEEE